MKVTGHAITLEPVKTARMMGVISLILITISLTDSLLLQFTDPADRLHARMLLRIDKLFNVDEENNIPSYFSMLILLLSAVLLGLIAVLKRHHGDPCCTHWIALSLIFHLMAFDEIVSLHERLIVPLRSALGTTDYFYYAWVIPGMAFVTVIACCFFRFLRDLPSRFRVLFVSAGSVYVLGVIGVELVEGHIVTQYGPQVRTVVGIVTVTVQESLEMAGVILFIYALLEYLRGLVPEVRIRFGDS